jgi:hypothetical protein
MGTGLLATDVGGFAVGLLVGTALGLLGGPVLRSRLAWREWVEASREAELTERFLARLEGERPPGPPGKTETGAEPTEAPVLRGTPPRSKRDGSERAP